MANATLSYVADSNGNYTFSNPINATQILELASSILESSLTRGESFTNPQSARDFAQLQLGALEYEVFGVMFLDTKHRLIAFEKMFRGTIDGASVHPREVVKQALRHNAAALILTHNHPSGVAEPSTADQTLTRRLKDALALVDIRVLDHVVVAASETTSLAERGLL